MKVLVLYETSGETRRAFEALGHEVTSCDLLPADDGATNHHVGDALDFLRNHDPVDLVIAHPSCQYLAVSGNRWHAGSPERAEALDHVRELMRLLDEKATSWAIENPVSVISGSIRKADFMIQPWQFGHGETKGTCFWTHNLPKLEPTNIVDGREQRIWKMGPSEDRWKERSKTFTGIATAIAMQWGGLTHDPCEDDMAYAEGLCFDSNER